MERGFTAIIWCISYKNKQQRGSPHLVPVAFHDIKLFVFSSLTIPQVLRRKGGNEFLLLMLDSVAGKEQQMIWKIVEVWKLLRSDLL
jgi:hypothetical protein